MEYYVAKWFGECSNNTLSELTPLNSSSATGISRRLLKQWLAG
jgi:hypothetical protein